MVIHILDVKCRTTGNQMPPVEIRTSLRMPQSLHEHLTRAAEANGHNFSDEVRQRLIASFDRAAPPVVTDQKTQALLEAISEMAYELAEWYPAPWHSHPFSARALMLAFAWVVHKVVPGLTQALENSKFDDTPGTPRPGFEMMQSATPKTMGGTLAAEAIRKFTSEEPSR
jgi:hypothetical protein